MADTELLPCPFCGGAARIQSNRDWHRLYADHDDECVFDADDHALMYPAQPGYLIQIAVDWNRRAALASRPAEVDDWISVLDRMPEPGQQVIAYRPTAELTQDSTVRIVRYLGAGRERESWQGVRHGFDCICHPTHWKPIPGAPSHTTNKEKG